MKISKKILIFIATLLLLSVNASAQTYASICMDNPPTGWQSENTCLLKPRFFSEFTYSTGYEGNHRGSISEAMDATVAYFSKDRTNICSVFWTVDSAVEPLNLDAWIESAMTAPA
ncbi:hypothetical protein H9K76_06415 [Diaphorobacter ruginosibacter]|uniref:Uncharacterized protein n=1 Tax=Diaphorobacter ruginosibacter TaxID=1715720 RepID=A0A7G9RS94_9BURK|nr:hypothetical protein [Diaphorobacter ruginosibacter]QNN58469.1 hypothetical protein H9K76_06415 [Diaphorobacter ruginosibacter]